MTCSVQWLPSSIVHVCLQISLLTMTCVGVMSHFACRSLAILRKCLQVQYSCFLASERLNGSRVFGYNVQLDGCYKPNDYAMWMALFEAFGCMFPNSRSFMFYLYTINWDTLYALFFIANLCAHHGKSRLCDISLE